MHGIHGDFPSGIFPFFVETGSFIGLEFHQIDQLSCLQAYRALPVSASNFAVSGHVSGLSFLHGFWDPNSVSNACEARTLLTEPSFYLFDYIKRFLKLLQSSFFTMEHLRSH